VRSHLPLVRAMARRYAGRGEELDDLVQAGSVGLVKASSRFDPSRGVAFATFVAPTVEGEIRRHLRDRSRAVRIPRETQQLTTELRRCRGELAASLGRSPDVRELAAALDADVSEVERLIAADLASDPIALPADGGAAERPADTEPLAESEYRVLLAGGLRALDERERRIVFLRFHADMTERQIARAVGISQAHVSRLLDGALTKLRAELTSAPAPAAGGDSTASEVVSLIATMDSEPRDSGGQKVRAQAEGATGQPGSPAAGPAAADAEQRPASRRRPAKPRSTEGYSGRILVRMPSELHQQLAMAAEREDVSLNRYVTEALSSTVDSPSSPPSAPSVKAPPSERDSRQRSGARPRGSLRVAVVTNLAVVVLAAVAAIVLLVLALQRGI
jgi:RNA polymerase sigma-B factor